MTAVLQLYEQLSAAPDDRTRARLIAEAFDALQARFPQIGEVATTGALRETELRLQKEIEALRKETAEIAKETKSLQKAITELDGRLEAGLKELELKMVELDAQRRTEMKQIEVNLQQAMTAQTRWFIAGLALLGFIFKLADILIP